MNAMSWGDSPQESQVPITSGSSMLVTTRSAVLKSRTSVKELFDESGVLGRHERVVDPVRSDAADVAGPGLRVDRPGLGAGVFHVGVELDGVLGGQGDPHTVSDLEVLVLAEPAEGDTEVLGAALVAVSASSSSTL